MESPDEELAAQGRLTDLVSLKKAVRKAVREHEREYWIAARGECVFLQEARRFVPVRGSETDENPGDSLNFGNEEPVRKGCFWGN